VAKPISPSLLGFIRLTNPEGATREQTRKSLGSLTFFTLHCVHFLKYKGSLFALIFPSFSGLLA